MALTKCKECGKEISSDADACPHCGKKVVRTSGCALVALGFIVLAVFVGMFSGGGSKGPRTDTTASAPPPPPVRLADSVKIEITSWRKGGFDTVMFISGKLTNNNDQAVQDIRIRCPIFAKSGTQLGETVKTLYETIPAKGEIKIKDFAMGTIHSQAQSSRCEVVDAK